MEVGNNENDSDGEANDALSAAPPTDLASAISATEQKKDGKFDPRPLLLYPIPDESESDSGLTTDSDDTEWESTETKKKKVQFKSVAD